jgi:hypothetical protein
MFGQCFLLTAKSGDFEQVFKGLIVLVGNQVVFKSKRHYFTLGSEEQIPTTSTYERISDHCKRYAPTTYTVRDHPFESPVDPHGKQLHGQI